MPAETREEMVWRLVDEPPRPAPALDYCPLVTRVRGKPCWAVSNESGGLALLVGQGPGREVFPAEMLATYRAAAADFPHWGALGAAIDECLGVFALARIGSINIITAAPAAEGQ